MFQTIVLLQKPAIYRIENVNIFRYCATFFHDSLLLFDTLGSNRIASFISHKWNNRIRNFSDTIIENV